MKRIAGLPLITMFGLTAALLGGVGCGSDTAGGADGGEPSLALKTTAATMADGGMSDLPDLPKNSGLPTVDLAGVYHPSETREEGTKVGALAMETPVYARADTSSSRLGVLRAGAIVGAESKAISGPGCPGTFRAIKPMGFVCLNADATLNMEHPVLRAATRRPDPSAKLPYIYGTVLRGGPIYARIPTAEDLKVNEPHLAQHLKKWERDKESGATYGLDLWTRWENDKTTPALDSLAARTTDTDIPWFLQNGGRSPNLGLAKGSETKIGEMSRRNGIAFIDTFLSEGRRYGLTTDLRVMPTDRFRPIRGSDYHGIRLPEEAEFPFAFVRMRNQKRWKVERGQVKQAGTWPWRTVVPLSGHQRFINGTLHFESKDGFFIEDRAASKVEVAKKMPQWATNGERWIDVNITKQLLILYEGTKPVYTTLVSTGEAGLGDPTKTKSTLRGIFRVHTKFVSATMDSKVSGEEFELRDVPYVQYFQDGYALHASYWHDVFGMPKSHGCINLAPEDARRIFYFTEPKVPEGWHGAAKALTGTVVFIHE
ncbi:MAG: L,D-transpeptidase [Polyangiaceae bacterium]